MTTSTTRASPPELFKILYIDRNGDAKLVTPVVEISNDILSDSNNRNNDPTRASPIQRKHLMRFPQPATALINIMRDRFKKGPYPYPDEVWLRPTHNIELKPLSFQKLLNTVGSDKKEPDITTDVMDSYGAIIARTKAELLWVGAQLFTSGQNEEPLVNDYNRDWSVAMIPVHDTATDMWRLIGLFKPILRVEGADPHEIFSRNVAVCYIPRRATSRTAPPNEAYISSVRSWAGQLVPTILRWLLQNTKNDNNGSGTIDGGANTGIQPWDVYLWEPDIGPALGNAGVEVLTAARYWADGLNRLNEQARQTLTVTQILFELCEDKLHPKPGEDP